MNMTPLFAAAENGHIAPLESGTCSGNTSSLRPSAPLVRPAREPWQKTGWMKLGWWKWRLVSQSPSTFGSSMQIMAPMDLSVRLLFYEARRFVNFVASQPAHKTSKLSSLASSFFSGTQCSTHCRLHGTYPDLCSPTDWPPALFIEAPWPSWACHLSRPRSLFRHHLARRASFLPLARLMFQSLFLSAQASHQAAEIRWVVNEKESMWDYILKSFAFVLI